MNVLIVDDDVDDRQNLYRECEKAGLGCHMFEAESVPQSLDILRSANIDCVLMDYSLPGEDGLAGLVRIRNDYPYLPVIMVTCYGDEMLAGNAFKNGAADYLPKEQLENLSWKTVIEDAVQKAEMRRELDENREYLKHFSDMLAHDLSSPVGHIVSFTDIAETLYEQQDYDGLRECLQFIGKSARNLQNLINAVALFAESGQEFALDLVLLDDAVEAAQNLLADKLAKSGAELSVAPLPVVAGNSALLSQVFLNLIANSLKFNRAETPKIAIRVAPHEDFYRVSVSDNGVGLPDDGRDIFKPFVRGHDRREFPGTGLGLATVQRIVERLGGRISAVNGEAGGAVFQLDLPIPDLGGSSH